LLRRSPKIKVFSPQSRFLPRPNRVLQGTTEPARGEKIGNPREVFYNSCFIAFESDEEMTFRLWDLFENIGLWSSDMPHLDASDVWEAIDHMNKWKVPQAVQEKMLGGNARRLMASRRTSSSPKHRIPTSR
jgi:hypothetical protein